MNIKKRSLCDIQNTYFSYPEVENLPFNQARKILKEVYFIDLAVLKDVPSNNTINANAVQFYDNAEFRAEIKTAEIEHSIDIEDRYFRCHSQAPRDFYILKYSQYKRIPDIVIWPKSHQEVELVVKLANKHNVVIIPVGGLSNVTCANNCPENETRTIVCLDLTQMNRMLWLDGNSMIACFETGIAGMDLERILQREGYIMGHEPDSIEFSTLGGWIATRSSGIKQQAYGNIEDIVVSTKTVTSIGVLEKSFIAPRVSMGPEFEHIILGSEGTLGVITEAVVRIHHLPKVRRFGSIVFPNFLSGIHCLHECARQNVVPSSLRLLDNTHVQFGHALRFNSSLIGKISDRIKLAGLTKILRYGENSFSVATYLIEGEKKFVNQQEDRVISIAWKYWGIKAGEKFGKVGYLMTFTVGYTRVNKLLEMNKQNVINTYIICFSGHDVPCRIFR